MIKKRLLVIFTLIVSVLTHGQVRDSIPKDSIRNYNLEEVVVSATRTIRQLSSLPLQVQLISQKEIERTHSSRLSDLLSEQDGIVIVPAHTGGDGVQLQGIDAQYTMILLDGVPLIGRSTGTLDLSRISVGDIEQVEVVKGASSSLYGSEALGGVINLITRKGRRGFYTDLNYRLSRFATNDLSVNIGYKNDKFGIHAFSNYYKSDGYTLEGKKEAAVPPYANYTTRIKTSYKIHKNTDISVSLRYYNQNQDYISSESQFASFVKEWNGHLKLDHKYNKKWSSFFEFYATQYQTDEVVSEKNTGKTTYESKFNQMVMRSEVRATFKPSVRTTYMGGVGWNRDGIDKTTFSEPPRMDSFFAYLQYEALYLDKINVIGGLRYDHPQEYPSQLSPKIAVKYDFSSVFSVKASVGYGFKAPDFRYLYYNFTNPSVGYSVLGSRAVPERIRQMKNNGEIAEMIIPLEKLESTPLQPESSISYNFGGIYSPISSLKLTINFFRNNIRNLISSYAVARKTNGQDVFGYHNVSKVYTQGLEANASFQVTPKIKLSTGYQLLYTRSEKVEELFEEGKVYARDKNKNDFKLDKDDYFGLTNRSRHTANAKLYVTIPEWKTNFNIRWIYRSAYPLFDTNGNGYADIYDDFVPGYSLVNMAVNKKFGRYCTVGVGMNNALDYTDVENINSLSGRILFCNLNIKL